MAVNPFFSPRLRLQSNHRLVAGGPYRFLRHPGYLAMLVAVPATAIALGSLAGLVPALGYQILILSRTMREDRLLREELGGYAEYAGTVRYRLVPGLW
jgi:protein-S-isoprenylcysteine O-methyltransferase Ste14